jgi:hypothetical protein
VCIRKAQGGEGVLSSIDLGMFSLFEPRPFVSEPKFAPEFLFVNVEYDQDMIDIWWQVSPFTQTVRQCTNARQNVADDL